MGIFSGCLLLSDIDDTLLDSNYIPQNNIDMIDYFVKEGGRFSICTGRTVDGVSFVTDKIKNISASSFGQSNLIYDLKNKKVLKSIIVSENLKTFIKEVLKKYPCIGIEAHYIDNVYTINESNLLSEHQKYESLVIKNVSENEIFSTAWDKAVLTPNGNDEIEKIKKIFDKYCTEENFYITTAFVNGFRRYYIDIVNKNALKSNALDFLRNYYKIESGNLFAIGDFYNDVDMLKNADVSAAPENSVKEAKDVADYVVCSVENGAVADFINKLIKLKTR